MNPPIVALAGSPNTGKTSIFNGLTGSRQKIGNYPGVTVERKIGDLITQSGKLVKVIDLPGTYGLNPLSPDEKITVDILTGKPGIEGVPDVIVAIADSTNLERSLRFVLELKMIGKPIVVAMNMMDLAKKRNLQLDLDCLSTELGVPVVPTIAIKNSKLDCLIHAIDCAIENVKKDPSSNRKKRHFKNPGSSINGLIKTNLEVKRILTKARQRPIDQHLWTQRIDKIMLHPFFGGIILAAILFIIFQAVFSWAETPMDWIETGIAFLGEQVSVTFPDGFIKDLLVDGMIAGVGSVLVFLPQITLLFLFIFLLESSGYMMRAAFILDQAMSKIGLQGSSVVPLLSAFACAIPGIMATRTIKNPRDRLITILITPLMTCSARLPVYVLLIGAFIPNQEILGLFNLQGLVMFGLFMTAMISAALVSLVIKVFSSQQKRSPMMMELPTYKWPDARNLFINLWQRIKIFLHRAGKLILLISIGLWVLSSYPKPPKDWQEPAITYSIAGRIGKAVEPMLLPIGFDWRIATGLIPGFAAREVMVAALGTVFAVEDAENETGGMLSLQDKMSRSFGLATGLALLVWYIFSPQCLATFAVMKRETNSWKWPIMGFSYMLLLAYMGAFTTYRIALFFTGS